MQKDDLMGEANSGADEEKDLDYWLKSSDEDQDS